MSFTGQTVRYGVTWMWKNLMKRYQIGNAMEKCVPSGFVLVFQCATRHSCHSVDVWTALKPALTLYGDGDGDGDGNAHLHLIYWSTCQNIFLFLILCVDLSKKKRELFTASTISVHVAFPLILLDWLWWCYFCTNHFVISRPRIEIKAVLCPPWMHHFWNGISVQKAIGCLHLLSL